jgi:hypothetical protein
MATTSDQVVLKVGIASHVNAGCQSRYTKRQCKCVTEKLYTQSLCSIYVVLSSMLTHILREIIFNLALPIRLNTREEGFTQGFTEDWARVKINNSQIDSTNFIGNAN